jgi:UDP-glucose 4-epimerase
MAVFQVVGSDADGVAIHQAAAENLQGKKVMTNWAQLHGDFFRGSRILVTGGAGFIGSHLTEALVALGADIVVIDDLSGGSWENLKGFGEKVTKITGSICDPAAITRATKGCRYIFHEAALASVPQSVAEPVRFYEINTMGTLSVMQAARECGVERVVYAGSSSAYGDGGDGAKTEDLAASPVSPYASSKLAGEEIMRAWSRSYGIDTAVVRYFNIFGPRQNANSAYAAVIAAFAKAFAEGRTPIIHGDGEQTRDFVFVHNVVHANLLAARSSRKLEGSIFNVGTGHTITVNQLYTKTAELMGKSNVAAIHQEPRAGDVKHSSADISKSRRELGYEPIVSFEAGLKPTIAWYRNVLEPAAKTR